MATIPVNACPVCNSGDIKNVFDAKDYTVSQQAFTIAECRRCTARFTRNIPDASSIGAYYQASAYVSHTDTSEGFVNKLYHRVRKSTLNTKVHLIRSVTGLQTGRLLDTGAGTGAFSNAAKLAGWQVTALEPDPETRKRAGSLYGLEMQDSSAIFSQVASSFDAITLWHVLEHVHDLHGYLEQFNRLLAPGGTLFIAVPNYTAYDAGAYQQYWAAYDVPRHLYHFSPAAMKHLLQQHQLQLVGTKPMWYDSFYVSMLSEQYKTGKSQLVKAVFTGLISNLKALSNTEKCSSIIYLIRKKDV